jgi:hypothetical protein
VAVHDDPSEVRVMKALRWTGFFGLAAVALYVGATAAGSRLDPSYSQISRHVSDLTASGAPTAAALAPVYLGYNLLALGLGIGLYLASDRSWLFKIGSGLIAINSFAGVMMVTWFREDLGGMPKTFSGTGHFVFAGISVIATLGIAFDLGVAFRRARFWRSLSNFSFAVGVGILILGPLGVVATAAKSNLAGLAERGPIGLFMLWLLVIAIFALAKSTRLAPRAFSDSREVA